MTSGYVELRAKSFFSFGEGAASLAELLSRAAELNYPALALADTNLCGALQFALAARSVGVKPITGAELTLTDRSRVTLLAKSRQGYRNLCQLLTVAAQSDRRKPRVDPNMLAERADGLVALLGGRNGPVSRLLEKEQYREARNFLKENIDWFGADSVYLDLERNLMPNDRERNRRLVSLASQTGVPLLATTGALYHAPERYRLQHALTAIGRNQSIGEALRYILPNDRFCLKSAAQMEALFSDLPKAMANSVALADQCEFDLAADLGYRLPQPDVPDSYTPLTYLKRLCEEEAVRRYGSISPLVETRLAEELRLIERNDMAGFLLLYREIALLARQIQIERGQTDPETPLAEASPGRGRGSSVALLAGYLIGISHIDPLRWNLTLERFLSEEPDRLPDIDLDFPRSMRDELIRRIHRKFGSAFAVLTGAITTYRARGIIADLGKALSLPKEQLRALAKELGDDQIGTLAERIDESPELRGEPGWKNLAELAPQLLGAPKSLGQHVGGMILSDRPIPEMVPVRAGATAGRYIMDWDKDSVADAGLAKIDILSLPVLDQIEEALDLIKQSGRPRPDLSQLDPEDPMTYDMINAGHSKGVFLLQSPAQLKLAQRLRVRNPLDLAYQVALIRPGVGVKQGAVSAFISRYRYGAPWEYDHPLEERALSRSFGIIIWQEQIVQLLIDIGGMSAAEADTVRRALGKRTSAELLAVQRERFLKGAESQGVCKAAAIKIFDKLNGEYMFPESHSHAFAATAYQAAWLKRHYPLEFYTALINNQPMGFYPLETIKQDARRFGVPFLNPNINRSGPKSVPLGGSILLGLLLIKDVGPESAESIVSERERRGPYLGAGDLARRVGLKPEAIESLTLAGAFDQVSPNRKQALWDAGLYRRPGRNGQATLPLSMEDSIPDLPDFSAQERMAAEYRTMGIYPKGHMMEFVRPKLPKEILTCAQAASLEDGRFAAIAGWPIARQRPRGADSAVYLTLEDETGDAQAILPPAIYARYRKELSGQTLLIRGRMSRWDGTANLIVSEARKIAPAALMPAGHDYR